MKLECKMIKSGVRGYTFAIWPTELSQLNEAPGFNAGLLEFKLATENYDAKMIKLRANYTAFDMDNKNFDFKMFEYSSMDANG